MEPAAPLIDRLKTRFGAKLTATRDAHGQTTIECAPEHLAEIARALREEFRFEQLIDVCGVDYATFGESEWNTEDVSDEGFSRGVEGQGPGRFGWRERGRLEQRPQRYAVVLHLLSVGTNARLRLRCFATDDALPSVPSVTDVWPVANWFEREAFDLVGILFEGHPDLRRILTDYGFVGHPFRKDFPLSGNVEVRYDAQKRRVVYEPVQIEPRVGVPRVVREDSRWLQGQAEQSGAKS